MKKILTGMTNTMNSVKPPRITALRDLHNAETGPFSILIGTILSARTKDETTTKAVKALFKKYKNPKDLANAKVKDCLLYTSPSPRDQRGSRMPSSA